MNKPRLRVGVIGAGNWGTALAQLLARREHEVTLWALEPEVVAGINASHKNPLFLREVELSPHIRATGDLEEAAHQADMILFVIPAQFVRASLKKMGGLLPAGVPLVICSKGIERGTLRTMEQVFTEELPEENRGGICVLSGPSFAIEVAQNLPTNVTVAARQRDTARTVQAAMATREFRIYTTEDVTGVELGGALKNVIAIAVGGGDGLGFGVNTRAGLITRGLAEVSRLAVKLGGRPETMLGLAGVGDLILTCTSDLSRNRTVGRLLGQGHTIAEIQRDMRQVAEGVPTSESAHQLAEQCAVEMPITEAVYQVVHHGKAVREAMRDLQDRALKEEWRP
jgi:glycerol-3-phosphate dehydrogenase (NAD(P)+)